MAKLPTTKPSTEAARPVLHKQRLAFTKLIGENPNYFGNLVDSKLPIVKKVIGNTTYEELTCVSFSPERDMLEATIEVKLPYGFSGDLCEEGSREYVRFFVDEGSGWQDAGLVAVETHDIPAGKDCKGDKRLPLSYTASLAFDPKRARCRYPMLPTVRAILSWQTPPPAGDPNYPPVWGNVMECAVQVTPRPPIIWDIPDIFDLDLGLPLELEPAGPFPIPLPDPPPFAIADLAKRYHSGKKGGAKGSKDVVEPHRFGLADIHEATGMGAIDQALVSTKILEWKELGLDWIGTIAALNDVEADTSYEELECLGLDNNLDRLVATFKVKLPTGYNGNLCEHGSTEFVAFWADWEDTCDWTYLGTAKVKTHDIASIPSEGLCYSAILPVDLSKVRRNCDKPVVARVRAVLSWNVPPSTVNPDALTTWGNRIDRHVQVRPGVVINNPMPIIGILGGIPVSKIHNISGLTTPDAFFALNGLSPDSLGRPCPFAARVVAQGPSFPGLKYRVQVRQVGQLAWSTVTAPFTAVDMTGTIFTPQSPDGFGYFDYLPFWLNVDSVLAWWDSTGDDLWEVRIQILGLPGQDMHRIQLDNTGPIVDVEITGGNCGKFNVGDAMSGTFVARDDYLGSWSLGTSPFSGPVLPGSGITQTSLPPGDAWSLNTASMSPCGYVIQVTAVDRAIVNSASVGHWASDTEGFCLE